MISSAKQCASAYPGRPRPEAVPAPAANGRFEPPLRRNAAARQERLFSLSAFLALTVWSRLVAHGTLSKEMEKKMIERLDYVSINGPAIASMAKAKDDILSINDKLRALIELRVSQINGCAYCVDLHTIEARKAGETTQRLDCLTVWREVHFFDEAEKAALEWAEAITGITTNGAPEHLYAALFEHFSETEIVDLTLIIAQMNAWNRLAISFGHLPDARA